jgi:uncharacterized protein DUF4266
MDPGSRRQPDRPLGAGVRSDKRSALLLAFAIITAILSGCAGLKPAAVKPWERDILARPAMQVDPEPMISGCDDHIYFSREASKGGNGFGGGGCGCN